MSPPTEGARPDLAGDVDRGRLPPRDFSFLQPVYPWVSKWLRTYFRADVRGLEHVPDGPVLFVANHSGGFGSPDSIVFILGFMDRFGLERPLYWLGHDLLFSIPLVGSFLERCGVVPAHERDAKQVLTSGGSLLVYPGGEVELHRPWTQRDEIQFQGRQGFLKLAVAAGVPIVPVVAHGGHDTYLSLSSGRSLTRWLRLDRTLRMKTFPIALSLPWGLTIGHVPHLPLPARVTVQVLPPVDVVARYGDDLDTAYEHLTAEMQLTLDRLAHGT